MYHHPNVDSSLNTRQTLKRRVQRVSLSRISAVKMSSMIVRHVFSQAHGVAKITRPQVNKNKKKTTKKVCEQRHQISYTTELYR